MLAALAAYAAVGGVVWGLVRGLGLDMATYWAPITFGNAGNLGLPVALFAFGQAGFDFAVVIFAVMAIVSFTFGVWVVAGGGNPLTAVREPLVWGTVAGSAFLLLGWRVPEWVGNSLDLVGQMAIPLMLITLGVAIARLRPRALGRAFWLCLVKLAICTAVPVAVGLAFGLPQLALGVLVCRWRRRWRSPPTCWRRSTARGRTRWRGWSWSRRSSPSRPFRSFGLFRLRLPLGL